MKRLYEKNALGFSLLWIALYVVLFSAADGISEHLGVQKLITAPLSAGITVFLLCWIKKHSLWNTYGLGKGKPDHKAYLGFVPLVALVSVNLWGGFALQFSLLETVLYVISMIGVGVVEEILFRGFLFRALCKESMKRAVIISSVTFGIGHIVNLLGGAQVLPTLLQIVYATAVGFLFTVIVYRSGSLIPCILTHCAVNSLSIFGAERSVALEMIGAAFMSIVALVYAVWILKNTEK